MRKKKITVKLSVTRLDNKQSQVRHLLCDAHIEYQYI